MCGTGLDSLVLLHRTPLSTFYVTGNHTAAEKHPALLRVVYGVFVYAQHQRLVIVIKKASIKELCL